MATSQNPVDVLEHAPARRAALTLFTIAALVLLSQCAPGDGGSPSLPQTQTCSAKSDVSGASSASVLVGRGSDSTFKPLTAGDVLALQHGPQGGTHVYLDVVFHADAPEVWRLTMRFARPGSPDETSTAATQACVGWNRVENVRLVVDAGDGTVDVKVKPVSGAGPELASVPVAVSAR